MNSEDRARTHATAPSQPSEGPYLYQVVELVCEGEVNGFWSHSQDRKPNPHQSEKWMRIHVKVSPNAPSRGITEPTRVL